MLNLVNRKTYGQTMSEKSVALQGEIFEEILEIFTVSRNVAGFLMNPSGNIIYHVKYNFWCGFYYRGCNKK